MNNCAGTYDTAKLKIEYPASDPGLNKDLPAGKYSGVIKIRLLVATTPEIREIRDEFYVNVEVEKK